MLLANVLRTLSVEEITTIRENFSLSERSRLLFERIAASPATPPDSAQLCKVFGITKGNLYRLFSEIVDECVRLLAPRGEFATMNFFRSKYLFRPFVTELHREEKALLRSGADKQTLERFYEEAFAATRNFPTAAIDLDFLEEIGMKWYRSQLTPAVDEESFVRLRVIFSRIAALPSRKKMTLAQMKAQAEDWIAPYRQSAPHSINPKVRCEYYQVEWKACMFDRSNLDKGIDWLRKTLDVARRYPDSFPAEWSQVLELVIAYELALYCGQAKDAFKIFQKYYRDQTPETSRGALFLFRYARVAFLAQEFKKTREILDRLDNFQIVRSTPGIYKIAILLRALLDMTEGNFEAASRAIEEARRKNNENYFLDYEVVIRGLETTFAFKSADFKVAEHLVARNIKWHHSRRISLSSSAWIYFYQIVGAIIRNKMVGDPIRTSLIEHVKQNFRLEHPDYYMLLESEVEALAA